MSQHTQDHNEYTQLAQEAAAEQYEIDTFNALYPPMTREAIRLEKLAHETKVWAKLNGINYPSIS